MATSSSEIEIEGYLLYFTASQHIPHTLNSLHQQQLYIHIADLVEVRIVNVIAHCEFQSSSYFDK